MYRVAKQIVEDVGRTSQMTSQTDVEKNFNKSRPENKKFKGDTKNYY